MDQSDSEREREAFDRFAKLQRNNLLFDGKRTMKLAWKSCNFCSRPPWEIEEAIGNPSRWGDLPLRYACGWLKICTIGAGTFGRTRLWQELCRKRGKTNSQADIGWTEGWCQAYQNAKESGKDSQSND